MRCEIQVLWECDRCCVKARVTPNMGKVLKDDEITVDMVKSRLPDGWGKIHIVTTDITCVFCALCLRHVNQAIDSVPALHKEDWEKP